MSTAWLGANLLSLLALLAKDFSPVSDTFVYSNYLLKAYYFRDRTFLKTIKIVQSFLSCAFGINKRLLE